MRAVSSFSSSASFLLCLAVCLLLLLLGIAPPASAADAELDLRTAMTVSYYELLGIPQTAAVKEIKKAYRTVALRYHPDKQQQQQQQQQQQAGDEGSSGALSSSGSSPVDLQSLFIRINIAAEVLSDETKRAQYDELLADGVLDHSDSEYRMLKRRQDERRYGRFQAYAMRTARGDVDWAEVAVMAMSLLCFVGPALRWCWVERRRRERAKTREKEAVKRSKKDVERRVEEGRKREEERERRRAQPQPREAAGSEDDEEEAAVDGESEERRKEKEARRARAKKVRTAFRAALRPCTRDAEEERKEPDEGGTAASWEQPLEAEDVELLLRELSVEELERLLTTMEELTTADAEAGDAREESQRRIQRIIRAELTRIEQAQQLQQRQRAATVIPTSASTTTAPPSSSSAAGRSISWSLSEVSTLAKAMARFPGGVSGRWEKIAAVVNAANEAAGLQHQRTVKELLARAKQDEARAVRRPTDRGEVRAALDSTEKTSLPAVQTTTTAAVAAEATEARPAATAKSETTESAAADTVKAQEDLWSAEEQSALESALRTIARDAADRWDRIAAAVATKSRKQCVARFRMIKASITASRA